MCLQESLARIFGLFALTDGSRPIPDGHRNLMNPAEKWESCPSISSKAVAHRKCQKLVSSRPNCDASFLSCPAPGQRERVPVSDCLLAIQLHKLGCHLTPVCDGHTGRGGCAPRSTRESRSPFPGTGAGRHRQRPGNRRCRARARFRPATFRFQVPGDRAGARTSLRSGRTRPGCVPPPTCSA